MLRSPLACVFVVTLLGLSGVFSPLAVHAQAPAAPAQSATSAPKGPPAWEKEVYAFDDADRTTPPPQAPIVFTGSSSIRRWDGLEKDFPGLRVMNRGFGGSQLTDISKHFDRVILRYKPRQVVIYSGSNDINAGKSVDEVVGELKAIVQRIHTELPKTRVLYISNAVNPARWAQREKVLAANQQIAAFLAKDPRDQFVDIVPAMTGADGQPKADIFVSDRLHMNRKGYELWIPVIKPLLAAP